MTYELKAGVLYKQPEEIPLARIKGGLYGSERQILGPDNALLLRTEIHHLESPPGQSGNVRYTRYIMYRANGQKYALGEPRYAEGDDPGKNGWPIYRMPRADSVRLTTGSTEYTLHMENSREYELIDSRDARVLYIVHRGVVGGWRLESRLAFPVCFLCGVFLFCRYLEQENRFLTV